MPATLRYIPILLAAGLLLLAGGCRPRPPMIELRPGMIIDESVVVRPGRYAFDADAALERPVLTVRGQNVVVDFNGAELAGSSGKALPDEYQGLAIRVEGGDNITLRNLTVRGYRVAILAADTDSLKILDADLSYNYRRRLYGSRDRENAADSLAFPGNAADEWLRDGAAVYLKNCRRAVVRGLTVTGGQNGLLLSDCTDGLFYNNIIQFNSGVGVGLDRCSGNRIMYNRLDWNVRGYSHGVYSLGQGSAGIMIHGQSRHNVIAFNSVTHCGAGLRFRGQPGAGGGNIAYGNDCSFAVTAGVAAEYGGNDIVNNRLTDCRYGIRADYGDSTRILANHIAGGLLGVELLNGNGAAIRGNVFSDTETGITLGAAIRACLIEDNLFRGADVPLDIDGAAEAAIQGNTFLDFDRLLAARPVGEEVVLTGNRANQTIGWGPAAPFLDDNEVITDTATTLPPVETLYNLSPVAPLPDGAGTALPEGHPRGLPFILLGEWGPYDFRSPSIWLREVEDDQYIFLLLGPQGNWKLTGGEGFAEISARTGTFPATIVARREEGARRLALELEFIGEAVTTPFGQALPRGTPVPFAFRQLAFAPGWWVRFYEYDPATSPLGSEQAFRELRSRKAGHELETDSLSFIWRGSPGGGIDPDRFATFAETTFVIPEGAYRLTLTSDDGVRLFLDGRPLIERWDAHPPAVDVLTLRLGGRHTIEVEHFQAGGPATLDLRIEAY